MEIYPLDGLVSEGEDGASCVIIQLGQGASLGSPPTRREATDQGTKPPHAARIRRRCPADPLQACSAARSLHSAASEDGGGPAGSPHSANGQPQHASGRRGVHSTSGDGREVGAVERSESGERCACHENDAQRRGDAGGPISSDGHLPGGRAWLPGSHAARADRKTLSALQNAAGWRPLQSSVRAGAEILERLMRFLEAEGFATSRTSGTASDLSPHSSPEPPRPLRSSFPAQQPPQRCPQKPCCPARRLSPCNGWQKLMAC